MCLAKAYLRGDGQRELLLQDVALIEIRDKTLRLSTIFGEEKEIEAVIRTVDFQNSSVVLERPR
ncbi:MAG: CooT family nickel-binding protein [Chloroflexi bacterium]|nr:CooT family nickel-binding protein [Chloroflexota bacterium]